MEDASVKELMETLTAQQELLQQLYSELDMEREATATAVNESLSMILRLQAEKAAVEMEASQYKRMAEEKMVHTEETLETFRDLIHQKEMQIAFLEFQVQAYRVKVMSMGCKTETTYPENMLIGSNGGTYCNDVRRGCSLPPNLLRYREEPTTDLDVPGESSVTLLPKVKDQDHGHVKSGDYNSYWEQIRRLDERVKYFSNSKDLSYSGNKINEMSRSCSLQSQASSNSLYDALKEETEPIKEPATPAKVHDIFEVPEATNGGEIVALPQRKEKRKLIVEDEIYPMMPDAIKSVISDDIDKNNLDQRICMSLDMDTTYPKPQNSLDVEKLYLKRPDATDLELQQMNRRLKRLEDERIMARQEIMREDDDATFLSMKAIKDQLNSIEDEIKRWRPKKNPPPKKEVYLTSLAEEREGMWTLMVEDGVDGGGEWHRRQQRRPAEVLTQRGCSMTNLEDPDEECRLKSTVSPLRANC
ncbi:hypothetical protein V2J09_010242 [Rumex salicifolius]